MKSKLLLIGLFIGLMATAALFGFQEGAPRTTPQTATPQTARTVFDQYCVGCHNDKTKTANFSLEKADLAVAGDHPEVWERVIRKMRAGMMPPPGLPRPPLATYEGVRAWLESEIDKKAAAH